MTVSGKNILPTIPLTLLMIFSSSLKYLAIPETVSPNPRVFLTILNIVLPASTNGLTTYIIPFLILNNGPSSPSTACFIPFIVFRPIVPKSLTTFMIADPAPSIAVNIFPGVKNLTALIHPLNIPMTAPIAPAPSVASNPIFGALCPLISSGVPGGGLGFPPPPPP